MLLRSQPLDPKVYKKLGLDERSEYEEMTEDNIESQFIGKMFDDILDDDEKVTLKMRIEWKWRDIKDMFYDAKRAIVNCFKWRKTISGLYPWEGFDGLVTVMLFHLRSYVEYEEKYGHSEEEFKKSKIASARETIEILERMKEPDEDSHKRLKEVETKYPDYKYLITRYKNGGGSYSGDFTACGAGWVGKESGKNPREGYFEFIDGQFALTSSPDQGETDRLLAELSKYHEEREEAYRQAEIDSEKDFEQLNQLLKKNLYSWWD